MSKRGSTTAAPPKAGGSTTKTAKAPMSAAAASVALSEAYLRNATEGQLVSRLLDVFAALETSAAREGAHSAAANAASSPKNSALSASAAAAAASGVPADFTVLKAHRGVVAELCKREYVASPAPDVQVAAACALSCAFGGGALAARGAPNPIPKEALTDAQCLDVLRLFVGTIERLQSEAGRASYHSYIRQMVEKLSARHGIHSLLRRLLPSAAATGTRGGASTNANASSGADGTGRFAAEADEACESLVRALLTTNVADDAMVGQMASIVCDVIEAHQSLTDAQLQLLLSSLSSSSSTAASSRRVALAVLRRKEEVVSPAVGAFLVHEVEAAVEEMLGADVAAIDDASEESAAARKAAVKRVGSVLESSMAVCRVGVGLASSIVPRLQQYLTADHNDIRLIFTRTFARIFHAAPTFAQSFSPAYHSFLGRFTDARVPIRAEMLKYAKEALAAAPLSDDQWALLGTPLEHKLVDADESIRRAAIAVAVDTALLVPRRVPNKIYSLLAARCKDKTPKVRAYAIDRLAELFLRTRLKWIPNAIMASVYVASGADAGAVEFAVNAMIPKPVDTTASAAVAANRKKQTTLAAAGKQRTVYTFDFEKEGGDNANANSDANNSGHSKTNIVDPTFLGGFVQLCACYDEPSWSLFLGLMHKKAQLRLTCLRLVEIRQALKAKQNIDANKEAAVRLINFLSAKTGGANDGGAWGTLFKEADDTATKWLHQLCDDASCTDYNAQGEGQLEAKVKGRAHNDVHKFLASNVVRRLCLPFSAADVTALLETIEADRKAKKDPAERLGALRALEAIVRMSPRLAFAQATPRLAQWIKEDSEAVRRGQSPALAKVMGVALSILSDIAAKCMQQDEGGGSGGQPLPQEVAEKKGDIIGTLGKICLSSEDGAVAKRAALCLTSLFRHQTGAFQQLMMKVQERLSQTAAQGEGAIGPTTIALVRTFGAFAARCPDAIVVSSDLVAESVTQIMLTAVRAHRDEDDVDAAVAARKNPNGGNTILTYPCLLAEVVDACAKALTRHALSLPGHSAAIAVPELFTTLLKAFKETQALPTGSVGACKRRLALHKQLMRLLFKGEHIFAAAAASSAAATTTTTRGGRAVTSAPANAGGLELMRRELSVVALISSEENDTVRHAVQAKLRDVILKSIPAGTADTRRVAMLCATAVAEDGKAGYTSLKASLAEVAERLAGARLQQKVTLSDSAKAWRYFLEYAVPPLVTYLAHHPLYEAERDDEAAPFKQFQRPWQLLFDEVLRDTTEAASALQEMFRKLRGLDDAVPNPPEPTATRVVCDLGCKVLLTLLGEKSVESGAQFPGSLLVPWYFTRPADEGQYPAGMVFLPDSVQVTARPLFGLPVGFLANNPAAAAAAAASKPSQSVARGASRSVAPAGRGLSEAPNAHRRAAHASAADDNDNAGAELSLSPARGATTSTAAKRSRSEAAHVDAGAASPQPKTSLRGAAAAGTKKASRADSAAAAAAKKAAEVAEIEAAAEDDSYVAEEDPLAAVRARIDASSLGDQCPSAALQEAILGAVHATIAKYPPHEVQFIKFGEIRVAVQEAIGRKWADGEKEYAKLCVVAQQPPADTQQSQSQV